MVTGTARTTPGRRPALVRHAGGERSQELIPTATIPLGGGPEERGDPAALDAWLAECGELVVGALREAGPRAEVWSWTGVATSGFWARRMAHEITGHRADAALTAGAPYEVAPDIAADALDEGLELVEWVQRTGARERAADLHGPARTLHLHATDAEPELNAEWLVEMDGSGVSWRRGHEEATVALRGPLTSVLLVFCRRLPLDTPGLEVVGERAVLGSWLENSSFG